MNNIVTLVKDDSYITRNERRGHTVSGKEVELKCTAENGAAKWFYRSLNTIPIGYKNTLTINAKLYNTGYYICFGYDKKKQQHFSARHLFSIYCKSIQLITV